MYLAPIIICLIIYKLFNKIHIKKGKDKKISFFIISVLCIVIFTIIALPIVDLLKNNYGITYSNFVSLYDAEGYSTRVTNYIIYNLIVFVCMYILILIYKKKYKKYNGFFNYDIFENGVYFIKNKLISNNATSDFNAIALKEFDISSLKLLLKYNIVCKTGDKYYIDLKHVDKIEGLLRNRHRRSKLLVLLILAISLFGSLFYMNKNKYITTDFTTLEGQDYVLSFPSKYIINQGENKNVFSLIHRNDISGKRGTITFESSYSEDNTIAIIDEESFINYYINQFSNIDGTTNYQIKTFTNEQGLYVVRNTLSYSDHYDVYDYVYLGNNGLYSSILTFKYTANINDSEVINDAKGIVQSINYTGLIDINEYQNQVSVDNIEEN